MLILIIMQLLVRFLLMAHCYCLALGQLLQPARCSRAKHSHKQAVNWTTTMCCAFSVEDIAYDYSYSSRPSLSLMHMLQLWCRQSHNSAHAPAAAPSGRLQCSHVCACVMIRPSSSVSDVEGKQLHDVAISVGDAHGENDNGSDDPDDIPVASAGRARDRSRADRLK